MKKSILSIFLMLFAAALLFNCTNDTQELSTTHFNKKNNDAIEIGFIDSNGNYIVYSEKVQDIKQQWEQKFGITISEIKIDKDYTIDNPDDSTIKGGEEYFVLIGIIGDDSGIVAMKIDRMDNSFLAPIGPKLTITCTRPKGTQCCYPKSYYDRNGNKLWQCSPPCRDCNKTEEYTF